MLRRTGIKSDFFSLVLHLHFNFHGMGVNRKLSIYRQYFNHYELHGQQNLYQLLALNLKRDWVTPTESLYKTEGKGRKVK